jgi:hypothetical protein
VSIKQRVEQSEDLIHWIDRFLEGQSVPASPTHGGKRDNPERHTYGAWSCLWVEGWCSVL